ncbi:MAG: glycosyltransferase [Pseudomonadales bacterium]|nr:glycosyltransferase [Pseudomonadales bacterium]
MADLGHDVTVLTFYQGGLYEKELADSQVQLLCLNKKGRWDIFPFLYRLIKILRIHSPEVIYSFLGTANLLSVIARCFTHRLRVVWSVRASNMDLEQYDWLSRLSYRLECRLARYSDLVIANSQAGSKYAVRHGFPADKMAIVSNGIDTETFHIDKPAGKTLRDEWGIAEDERLIGVVGRIDPMKGIPVFLEAAALISKRYPNLHFVWVGTGDQSYTEEMVQLSAELGLNGSLLWAGRHSDMVAVYNALDIASSSSSYGEGFPNVLGEAMACGVPCVVTDIGDSALVVGDTGLVVPAKNSQALADAWGTILSLDSTLLHERAIAIRSRVVDKFSVSALIQNTSKLLFADSSEISREDHS